MEQAMTFSTYDVLPEIAPSAVEAQSDASFVIGSAARHPYPLVRGDYSLHTNRQALLRAEEGIRRIGRRLHNEGRI
jgi:hypothetical protein